MDSFFFVKHYCFFSFCCHIDISLVLVELIYINFHTKIIIIIEKQDDLQLKITNGMNEI